MSIQTHEAIVTEQFGNVLEQLKLHLAFYERTGRQDLLLAAAQDWGILQGLAMAASQAGIVSLQAAFDELKKSAPIQNGIVKKLNGAE